MWTRLLSLELGHTTAAASAVLAGFMGGLAIGAVVAGAFTARLGRRSALRAYAAIEIAIAVLALLAPAEIAAAHPVLALAYGDGPGGLPFQCLRFAIAVCVVGVPAALMGATYPLIVHAADAEGRGAGALYASNTFGAAAGALAAGFVLLPLVGLFRSTLIGVAGNLIVAAIAWRTGRRCGEPSGLAGRTQSARPTASAIVPGTRHLGLALSATAVSGFVALSLELAWTRTLAMVMGPTTYAFSAMVACFIIGIALGSAAASASIRPNRRWADRPEGLLALALAFAAAATAWGMGGVDEMVLAVARRSLQHDVTYFSLVRLEVGRAAMLLLPSAFAFGAAFPLALAVARTSSSRDAAWVYGANTMGGIAGALVTAGSAIPLLGLHRTFAGAIALAGAAAVAIVLLNARRLSMMSVAALGTALVAAAMAANTSWNASLLSSGAYKYAAYIGEQDLETRLVAGTLRYYREGASGTVAVRDVTGVRTLSIDGKVDASNGGDMLTQRLLAHVPLLQHPAPERVAIVGLGSGVTLGSALTHPVAHVDVIEISPEVVQAAEWFSRESRKPLLDARVRLLVGDARTHFRLSPARYDVVISEPSNPWMAGVAPLFTREFFETLRARLRPGGLVCQWAHTYDISARDLRSIVGTFASVFPHVTVWLIGDGDLLLVGSARPLSARLRGPSLSHDARADLAASRVTSLDVLEHLRLGDRTFARRWSGDAALQSDDRLALEFSAPAATIGVSREDNARALLGLRDAMAGPPATDPAVLRDVGLMALGAQAPGQAWDLLNAAATRLPDDRATLDGLVRAAAMSDSPERLASAESLLRSIAQSRPSAVAARLEWARLLASGGSFTDARRVAHEAEQAAPADADVQETLAAIAADAEDATELARAVSRLRALRPASARASYFEAVLRMLSGHPEAAVGFARAAVAADPRHAPSWNLLGSALGSTTASADEIRYAFAQAIEVDPTDATAYVNLGTLELSSGRAELAANWFSQALTLSPAHEGARQGLAAARAALQ